jgi:hypothetical protein
MYLATVRSWITIGPGSIGQLRPGAVMDKLHIKNEMKQLDRKNRGFYDELTDEERKKFSLYLMIRWSSQVDAGAEVQEYYVQSCNHYLNRHFFAINRHPRLQWLAATAVSPGIGSFDHHYIKPKKKETGDNEVKKTLMELYPTMKMSDIESIAAMTDKKTLKEYLAELGR